MLSQVAKEWNSTFWYIFIFKHWEFTYKYLFQLLLWRIQESSLQTMQIKTELKPSLVMCTEWESPTQSYVIMMEGNFPRYVSQFLNWSSGKLKWAFKVKICYLLSLLLSLMVPLWLWTSDFHLLCIQMMTFYQAWSHEIKFFDFFSYMTTS